MTRLQPVRPPSGDGPSEIVLGMDCLENLGGVQTVVRTLARAFAEHGHAVSLLDIEPSAEPFRMDAGGPVLDAYRLTTRRSGLPYEPTTRLQTAKLAVRGHTGGLLVRRRAVAELRALADAHPSAIWLLTQWRLVEHAVSAGIGARTIGQYHSSFGAAERSGDLARIQRHAPSLAAFCVLTKIDAARFRRAGVPRVHVVTNPVAVTVPADPNGFRPPTAAHTVVAVGRFVEEKAFPALVEAWSRIGAERSGWRLRIVGSGPLRAEIGEAITCAGVGDSVTVEPAVHDVAGLYAAADVFALSSIDEGLPVVLTESMSAGVPFVSTPCAPGVVELADGGAAGVIAASGDPGDLADALASLMADPERRRAMGEHGRRFLADRSPSDVVRQWETLFARLGLDRRGLP